MCPQICVGSLVADRPITGPLHVGEVITFRPPGVFDETYTHQIMKILPDGRIQTHGVVDKTPDPWLLHRSNLVGRVVISLWGIGWLLKALPVFAIGTMAWIVLRPGLPARWKRPSDRVWLTAMILIPLWTLDPLLRATIVSSSVVTGGHHLVEALVVNTGILPETLRIGSGQAAINVDPGATADLVGPTGSNGAISIQEYISLYWWGWTALSMLVLSPLIGFLWHSWKDDEVVEASIEIREYSDSATTPVAHDITRSPKLPL